MTRCQASEPKDTGTLGLTVTLTWASLSPSSMFSIERRSCRAFSCTSPSSWPPCCRHSMVCDRLCSTAWCSLRRASSPWLTNLVLPRISSWLSRCPAGSSRCPNTRPDILAGAGVLPGLGRNHRVQLIKMKDTWLESVRDPSEGERAWESLWLS